MEKLVLVILVMQSLLVALIMLGLLTITSWFGIPIMASLKVIGILSILYLLFGFWMSI